jgi:hypothetical protein
MASIAHSICAYTEDRKVLATFRITTAWQLGFFKRSRRISMETKEDFVLPRPPFSTSSLIVPDFIAL